MTPMKEAPVQQRRKYDKEFKRQAVEHWLSSGRSAEVVAHELGITAKQIYAWRKDFGPSAPGGKGAEGADLQARVYALERELARVREQRDILKKTLGILSEPPTGATNGSKP
jgi:transposase-like protein